jgi:hypothetical protein
MKYIILFFLSLFATSLPIISFSQMEYSTPHTITQQIPSTNNQSQPSYLILATIIINDSGGTKVAKDFTVNIVGKTVGKSFILASFQALPSPEIKIVSMQEGNYSLSISNAQGYKVSQQNECQGDIKAGEVKTCLLTLNDETTATAPFPPQTDGGGSKYTTSITTSMSNWSALRPSNTTMCSKYTTSITTSMSNWSALRPSNTTMCSKYTTTSN